MQDGAQICCNITPDAQNAIKDKSSSAVTNARTPKPSLHTKPIII
jgi:hypothetical protein